MPDYVQHLMCDVSRRMLEQSLLPGSVLLLDAAHAHQGLLFTGPRRVITCTDLADAHDALRELDSARAAGAHLAGYFAYEFGFAFEDKLKALWRPDGEPLLWFGVYDEPDTLSLEEVKTCLGGASSKPEARLGEPGFDMDHAAYEHAFSKVQDHLAKGDIYQVNLTMRARVSHRGAPEALFLKLLHRQPVAHGAFLKLKDRSVLSLSPELFLEKDGSVLRARPMKGTAARGRNASEDRCAQRDLAADPKQRAENIMIVDLMRNDMSRIAPPGSVRVTDLCRVERYKSLHQMTSTIEAVQSPDVGLPEIIARLFPCGSITGAPKLSAMMIAHDLETGPRGIYTGSIGHIRPNGDFRFNVAIRTLVLRNDGSGVAGAGSGVIFDSGATPEYEECALKLRFMTEELPKIDLIETMAFLPSDGYLLLPRHLDRLKESAAYFGYICDPGKIELALTKLSRTFRSPRRVRLEMEETGAFTLSHVALEPTAADAQWDVVVADEITNSSDRFLFHKTTHRAFYDDTRGRYMAETGCQEVLFRNENGFLTEGSFTTLFVKRDGHLLTPALCHGVLPGTLRAALVESGRAVEADLMPEDLAAADEIYVGNSVRGLVRIRLCASTVNQARDLQLASC